MRLKLILKQGKANQTIPINYQYAISSFIYHSIESSNSQYSKWLHEKGFASGNKKFKLFTFSKLNIPKRNIENSSIRILSDEITLLIELVTEKTIEHFVSGIFMNTAMRIFNKVSEAEFQIIFVETVSEPLFMERMIFKTLSPIVLSKKVNGFNTPYYLNPCDEDYQFYFSRNLEEKFIAYNLNLNKSLNSGYNESAVKSLKILNTPRSNLITIKEGSPDETKIRGFEYSFEIQAQPELIRLGYETGFGINNSLGFGCVGANSLLE